MELFPIFSVILATAAVASWLNHRFVGLPTTIGVMLIALAMSLGIMAMDRLGLPVRDWARGGLEKLDLQHTLLDVMLAFLLFAGALHVNLSDLRQEGRVIGVLATAGVLASTLLVGSGMWLATEALGASVGFLPCLLFGALISPTDPVAVLGILKSAGAPRSLETKIVGESLFNDGIGVVVFLVMLALAGYATGDHGAATPGNIALLLAREVAGAVVLGLVCGYLAFLMLRSVDNYQVEVLITLALATGLYSLAAALHASGPLAVVVAGLLIGNGGRRLAMSSHTVEHLDKFWELVDEILNVILFLLIGLEILIIHWGAGLRSAYVLAGLAAIPLVLAARFLSIGGAYALLRKRATFVPHAVKIMTWAGLRGGISVALALAIRPDAPARDLLLTMTYVVVVFSISVQGLTVGRVVRLARRRTEPGAAA